MEDNFTHHRPVPSRRSSDQRQKPPQCPPEPSSATLPPLRPSNLTPRRYHIPQGSISRSRGAEAGYSLHSTNGSQQSPASQAALRGLGSSSAAYQQTPRTLFPGDSNLASCGPIDSPSHFAPKATVQVADSLFVDQGRLHRGNPLLDNLSEHIHTPSSPLRIPSSPNGDHIANLRFQDKLQSRAFKTGFFPDPEEHESPGSTNRIPVEVTALANEENNALQEGLAAIKVSGFILEDDIEEGCHASSMNKVKHTRSTAMKPKTSVRPRASPLSSILVSHDAESQSLPKKQSAQNSAARPRSSSTHGTGQGNAVATAKNSTVSRSFSLKSHMMAKAHKPSIRVVTVPQRSKPTRRAQRRSFPTTPSKKPKVLNQRRTDPDTLSLVAIKNLPGPLYEPERPMSGFDNNKLKSPTLSMSTTADASSYVKSPTSPLFQSRKLGCDTHDPASVKPPIAQNKMYHPMTGNRCPMSEGEELARRQQATTSQYKDRQAGGSHMPSRIGRAQVHPGNNPASSERQLVEGLRSPGGWHTRNPKRSVSCVLSPKSIQEQEPEKKRIRDKEASLRTEVNNRQRTKGSGWATSSHRNNPTPRNPVADVWETPEVYVESVEDHVKTLHRAIGPMKRQRLEGMARLNMQRKFKKEQHSDDGSPALSSTAATTKRASGLPK
ncbi:hypothetical protein CORC01_10259 [Colletotrichum orchidophilum]|uniref:Uncharacterized protein n=1 Tax=Colletotrichum orchidophilum TaxID=1209926 RepID=A0A1G4AZ49_9PEZI|nr:uncharacterized protein CORC01_10259 [Colletotrichum orchidophilum]OHE94440.1 hypothetical protein CORC01_10259 [Colletotrichum orchidophilum]